MKSIGLLVPTLNHGGAERVVSRVSEILRQDYNVSIIVFEKTEYQYKCNVPIISMELPADKGIRKIVLFVKRIFTLKRIKKENSLDWVISFLDSPNVINVLSPVRNCQTGISVRNYSKMENKFSILQRITNLLMKLTYKYADCVIAVSHVIGDLLINEYSVKEEKIKVIYNPFDISEIKQLSEEPLSKEHSSFYESHFVFTSIGRHQHQKGYWHLVKAFKLVCSVNPHAGLVIIGKDYQLGQLRKLVNELDISNNVLLIDQHSNPFKFLRRSKVYVLSSLFEGFPNSLLEAMICGCAVIATDCKSGPREILSSKPNYDEVCKDVEFSDFGILVPPFGMQENWNMREKDIEDIDLATAMQKLLDENHLLEYYRERSLKRSRDFSYEKCKNDYNQIIV